MFSDGSAEEGRDDTKCPKRRRKKKIKKFVAILSLVLPFILLPMLTSPAHAAPCPTSSASNKIEGCVVDSNNGNPVPGLHVFIITCGLFQLTAWTLTDSSGHFSFQGTSNPICIFPNSAYPVTVNGVTTLTVVSGCHVPAPCGVLGVTPYEPTWGQWAGDVQTDFQYGYKSVVIELDPAVIANVPAAALYSNTQFASLSFSMSQTSTYSIGVNVKIGSGSSVQAGFSFTRTLTSTNGLTQAPNTAGYLGLPSYIIDYYCAGSTSYASRGWSCSQGLQTAGVSGTVPGNGWSGYPSSEFLNPTPLTPGSYLDCSYSVAPGQTLPKSSTFATGTTTNLGISSAFTFRGIGITLSYTFTISQSTSDTTGVTFSSTNGQARVFRLYPAGNTCTNPTFGPELHVWDLGPPGFTMSLNPNAVGKYCNPLGCPYSLTTTSYLTVTSTGGFSGTVNLSYSPQGPTGGSSVSGPSSVFVPAMGSVTATLSAIPPTKADNYYWTIQGTSGPSTASTTLLVYYWSCYKNCPI